MTETHIVLSDIHIPFHDEKALGVALNVISHSEPRYVHLLGDVLDCYKLSRFDKDPGRRISFPQELELTTRFLDDLRDHSPGSQIIFYEGNHEDRFRKFKWSMAKELVGLLELELPHLLGLERRQIGFFDYSVPNVHNGFTFYHGDVVQKHGGQSALRLFQKYGQSHIMGHSHRLAVVRHSILRDSDPLVCIENGCLCGTNPEYLNGKPDWQQGFSVLTFHGRSSGGTNHLEVEQVPIYGGEGIYRGETYHHSGYKLR